MWMKGVLIHLFVVINVLIDDSNSIEVSCVDQLTKRLFIFKADENITVPYQDVTIQLPDYECFIDDPITLDENETLIILPPNRKVPITQITFAAPSTLPEFPLVIFQTFPNLTDVRLIYSGIEVLEEDDFINATELRRLRLEQNNIEIISKTAFAMATKLQILTLPVNRIRKIEDYTFAKLKNLEKLDLQQNNLTYLREHMFTGADSLREIFLNDNQIDAIEDGAFYLEKLERIYLQDNLLKTLSPDLLTGTRSLFGIDLAGNRLTDVQNVFDKCSNLTVIGLNDNEIESIDWIELANIPSLMILSMENNNLQYDTENDTDNQIRVIASESKTHLEYLNLRANNLSTPNILKQLKVFRRLKFLDLSDNAFITIDDFEDIDDLFPRFIQLNLDNNTLSCKWLEEVLPAIANNSFTLQASVQADGDDAKLRDNRKEIQGYTCSSQDDEPQPPPPPPPSSTLVTATSAPLQEY